METAESLLFDLNDEQKQAVIHGDGPLLIVAGAGTGKTTVITRRIAWLILTGKCKPEEILALTFTEKAAGEMEERVDRLMPYGYVNLWISTFHAFCQKMLERHGLDIGIPHQFKLIDTTASWLLVRKNFDRFDLDYYRPLGNPTKFIHALLQHFSRAKDEAILPEEYLRYAEELALAGDSESINSGEVSRIKEIANAYHVYQQLLLENNALDFGDLLLYTRQLFVKRPAILEHYRKQFKYVLVDEFQDTNWVQYDIIKMLAEPRKNVTIVADDDQAIFLWRGASYHNILQFKKEYPESKEVFLIKNYRSRQNILDLAYQFIQHNNPDRLEWQLGKEGSLSKKLQAHHPSPGIIEHIHCATLEDECDAIIAKINAFKDQDPDLLWSDIAILVRSNDAAGNFSEACAQAKIPYQFFALKGLYTKPVILDMIAYCTLLSNFHESVALWRVFNISFFGLTIKTLANLSHYASQHSMSLWSAAQKIDLVPDCDPEDIKKIKEITAWIEKHTSFARTKKSTELFLEAVRDIGYLAYLKDADTEEKRDALSHLDQFYKKMKGFQAEMSHTHMRDFLELIKLEQEAGERGSLSPSDEHGADVVHIQTCHSAKGLEFRYVFVVNLVDRRFPTAQREDAIELPRALIKEVVPEGDVHLEEERRLFYVALTRAKEGCFLTSSYDYGGARKKKPSRFLYELGIVHPDKELQLQNMSFPRRRESSPTNFFSLNGIPDQVGDDSTPPSSLQTTNYKLPTIFSYSQIAAFQKCPLQYKFGFLLRIPVFGKPSLSFGKTIHGTLHHFFQAYQERMGKSQQTLFTQEEVSYTNEEPALPSLDDLFTLYEEQWIDEWYSGARQQEEYKQKGQEILRQFYAELLEHPANPKWLEKDFTIKVGTPPNIYTIKGRIDRVDDCGDGTVEIIDYKTGASKDEKSLKPEDKEQLFFYQIASEEVFGEKPARLTYHYLDDGNKVSFLGSDDDKIKLKAKTASVIEKIKKSDFAATPGWHCKFCDFREICEYRKY